MKRYSQSFFTAFITAVLVAGVMNVNSFMDSNSATQASLFGSSNTIVSAEDLNNRLANIAEKVNPAIVTVFSVQEVDVRNSARHPFAEFFGMPRQQPQEYQRRGMGSGVIVSEDGYILTNNHVIENADELKVRIKSMDQDIVAKVVGTDPQSDVAVLKIDAEDLPTVKFGNSEKIRVGEMVLAVGSPLQETLAHTVTMGIVSAKGRSNLNLAEYEDFIQTDAAINPGNSGGALVNLDGELIGINTAIASRTGGNQGIGFSIPVNMAKSIMESLIEYGKVVRGYLGVYMAPLTPELTEALDLENSRGVLVQQVVDDSPAQKAGLESGDVIIEMNGKEIKDFTELKNRIATTKPGRKIDLTIVRNGEKVNLTPVLEELDGEDSGSGTVSSEITEQLQFNYQNLNNELRESYNISDQVDEAVVVTSISPRSEAYRKGLREGDAIMSINRQRISNVAEFESIVSQIGDEDVVMLRIARGNVALFIAFEK
jgi:serine protease Do